MLLKKQPSVWCGPGDLSSPQPTASCRSEGGLGGRGRCLTPSLELLWGGGRTSTPPGTHLLSVQAPSCLSLCVCIFKGRGHWLMQSSWLSPAPGGSVCQALPPSPGSVQSVPGSQDPGSDPCRALTSAQEIGNGAITHPRALRAFTPGREMLSLLWPRLHPGPHCGVREGTFPTGHLPQAQHRPQGFPEAQQLLLWYYCHFHFTEGQLRLWRGEAGVKRGAGTPRPASSRSHT